MKVFLLTIIVVWTMNHQRTAGTQEIPTQFPTQEACMAEFANLQKNLPERLAQQGATDVEIFGHCQLWGKPVR